MKKVVLFCCFISLIACSKKDEFKVSQEKMVDVIYDLTVASSARNTANRRDSVQHIVSYQTILKKHGLDSLQFINAQKRYQKNPEIYTAIYDSVLNRLQVQLDKAKKSKPEKNDITPEVQLKSFPLARLKQQ